MQMTLFADTHHEKARVFDEINPWVMHQFAQMAMRLKANGVQRFGMQALFETLRYQVATTRDPLSEFKLNNNYAAWYAREIMRRYPNLDGFFEIRRSEADK